MQLTGSQNTDPPTPRKPSCGHALDNDPADAIPWLRVFVEGVVIVGSILLALAADAWLAERQDRGRERDVLERLEAEFVQVDSVLIEWRAYHSSVAEGCEVLLAHIGPGGSAILGQDSIGALLWTITLASTVDPPRAALASLESSGRLGALRNQELVTALASWLALLDDLQGDEELVARRLEENLYPYLNSHVALRTVSSFDKGHLAGEPSSFPNGLMEVLASREFENLLDLRRTDARIIMDDYDAVRASLARVRSLIEQEVTS